jgi:hypothetical protein
MRSYCFSVFMNLRFQVLRFLIGQISFRMLKEKKLATLKQIFFLRILQTFDTRLRKLRTVESQKQQCFDLWLNAKTNIILY